MAYHGPAYGLSRECQMKSQAKFSLERAREALDWVEAVLDRQLNYPQPAEGLRDQLDFAHVLKDGITLCELINSLEPGAVKKINTMKAPFKQRENVELFLKGCENYGLKSQDLFQVNDLYEHKNLYMVVDTIFALGGMAQKKNWDGPTIGVKVADENPREFSADQLAESHKIIGLQYGSNKGATQSGMTPYGATRQILPDEFAHNGMH
ncbi:myophilin [Daphnia magna]|uniref:Transgelin n=1 Tax=Daphnia magna TaxID=35525 RepID=A0A0P6F2V1_9CRUS|nr:myophilin [Daphnia magna]KAK4003242.1 hypothetical protein OUZ56_005018 [Daphnia magna]